MCCSLPVPRSFDLDLRHAAAGGGNAVQVEPAQGLVVLGHLTLALEYVDLHGGLVVGGGGEDLALLHGDGGVALDELGHHAAHGLDAQGQGGDVQQQQVLHVAGEHAALEPLKPSLPVSFFTSS